MQGGRVAQCPRAKRSAVQAFTTASCCGALYIHLATAAHNSIMLLRPVKQGANAQQKQQTNPPSESMRKILSALLILFDGGMAKKSLSFGGKRIILNKI